MDYDTDVMEKFVVDFMNSPESPNEPGRYGLLRGALRAPGVGWMMYNMLVRNDKSIESQYKSHVYADQSNVTEAIIQSRYELTKQKGSHHVPAAFY